MMDRVPLPDHNGFGTHRCRRWNGRLPRRAGVPSRTARWTSGRDVARHAAWSQWIALVQAWSRCPGAPATLGTAPIRPRPTRPGRVRGPGWQPRVSSDALASNSPGCGSTIASSRSSTSSSSSSGSPYSGSSDSAPTRSSRGLPRPGLREWVRGEVLRASASRGGLTRGPDEPRCPIRDGRGPPRAHGHRPRSGPRTRRWRGSGAPRAGPRRRSCAGSLGPP